MSERAPLAGRFPLSAAFELTARCNLRCRMCFIRVDERRIRELGARELTAAEWIGLARQAAEMGTLNLLLTGGEPMLRPDFAEIYEAVMGMGFFITLYTNATLITPEIRELLTRLPPHKIGVTLYGASPETYERTCGTAAGYERALEGISFLNGLPGKLEIRTTLIKDNVKDLDGIRALAGSFGRHVPFTISNIVSKAVRGGVCDVEACRLSPEEQLELYIDETVRTALEAADPLAGTQAEAKLRNELSHVPLQKHRQECESGIRSGKGPRASLFGCGAGMDQYAVAWDGRLIGCQMLDQRGTDGLQGLRQAWEQFPETVALPQFDPICLGCTRKQDCMACPATRLAESGSLGGIPEYSCRLVELSTNFDVERIRSIYSNEKVHKTGNQVSNHSHY